MARNKNIKALNIGTRAKAISRAQDEAFYALLRETDIPTLALHGGQGILASAYGAKTGPMRDLRPGEPDPYPAYEPGRFKEWGFCTVRVAKRDPLFDGLGDEIVVEEAHASEVKELPADLVLLAASKECPVQVFKHRSKLQYGVQFRANRYDDQHPDGKAILRNFFRAAGIDVARTVPVALESFRAVQMEGIQDLYEPPARLRTRSKPLICYVDTERPDLIQQRQKGPAGRRQADKLARVKKQLEAVTPLPVLVVHYTQIHKTDFDPKTARTILVSGRSYPIIDVLTRELFVLIRETRIPTFGFCGGHQLIAQAYGAKVGSMRPLKPGEKDPAPFHGPGLFKEWGFLPVRTVKTDPLFQGLGTTLVVQEYHYGEVKELPEGFDLLASDDECRIQAMKHRDKILYGTQFHPEDYDEKHPDGRQILKNFFRIAGVAVR
jgi:GMP synthase-like glutamine amidotransferase